MSLGLENLVEDSFVDRRSPEPPGGTVRERRQFTDSRTLLSPEAQALATAVDAYKVTNRRRFITYEEMLAVIKSLGYAK